MTTLLTTVFILGNIYSLAFFFKLILDARDFFFDPVLRPIERITEPILVPLRKIFRPTQTGLDYSPLIAIMLILCSEMVAVFMITPFSVYLSMNLVLAKLIAFFLRFYFFCVILSITSSLYDSNPLLKITSKIVKPFKELFFRFAANRELGLIFSHFCVFLIGFIFWHVISSLLAGNEQQLGMLVSGKLPDVGVSFTPLQTILSLNSVILSMGVLLITLIKIYQFFIILILVNWVASWAMISHHDPFMRLINATIDPLLCLVRKYIPSIAGLDLSPMIAILLLSVFGRFSIQIIQVMMLKAIGG